jgi:hypothetical protein
LCRVRVVEALTIAIVSWTGVVAANDEARAAEVASDYGISDRLTRARQPHRQRQQLGLYRFRRPGGKFEMGTVHWVAGLKRQHT